MSSSGLVPQNYNNKAYGFALRCVSLGFTFSRRYPLSYVYSGYYRWDAVESGTGNVYGQDNHAMWWSATAKNESYANHLNILYL